MSKVSVLIFIFMLCKCVCVCVCVFVCSILDLYLPLGFPFELNFREGFYLTNY